MKRLVTVILFTLTSVACASPGGSQTTARPSLASQTATPAPSPTQASAKALIIVPSPDGKKTLVEDFTDPVHPVSVYTVAMALRNARFISATEIGYTTTNQPDSPIDGATTIWRMNLDDMQPHSVATLQGDAIALAWNPDGSSIAFIAYTGPLGENRLWLKSGSSEPRTITPLIPVSGREYISTDQITVAFSPDGKFLLMVDTIVTGDGSDVSATFQIRQTSDGRLLWVPPSARKANAYRTSMAVWSHLSDRLYYADPDAVGGKTGIHVWEPFDKVSILAGVTGWTSPSLSPDDRFVAYEVDGTDGKPHITVRDLQSETVRLVTQVAGQPIMLSDSELLERHFVRQIDGAPGPPYIADRYFALNLTTNAETPMPAGFEPMDIWPH